MPKAPWMREVTYGSTVRSLSLKKDYVITGIDWGTQRVKLKSPQNITLDMSLERYYEYFEPYQEVK